MGNKRGRGGPEEKSENYVARKLFGQNFFRRAFSDESAKRIMEATQAVFQPERECQELFVPTVRAFFDKLIDGEREIIRRTGGTGEIADGFAPDSSILPPTYKGVSYNPLLLQSGERFDILDFFSWGKAAQAKEKKFRFMVLDATLYWVVNAMGRMPISAYSCKAAEQVVGRLRSELESNPLAAQITKASDVRNRYLLAIASLFPNGSCQVITAKDLWYGNEAYLGVLQKAIDFVVEWPALPRRNFEFRFGKFAQYSRYNQEYQKWYTPLVLAEAEYLYRVYGVTAKLGPTSETAFDRLIRDMVGKEDVCDPAYGVPFSRRVREYDIFWYTRPLESKIPYEEYVFFSDSDTAVKQKLEANPQLAAWLREIVAPFVGEKPGPVADAVNALKNRINRLAADPPVIPPAQGDWWFLWPPGSCG